ncbi:MAG: sigma-54 dependent transcriptional regulator [Bacteroidales bacterium]|jgi:transcriptional regulator with PAS, ATPase and Fis domain|nr:sigma-54-dependent Fis family transcriptional regulator [Lentimicrobium sp.]HNY60141.1 sigma-54 dependent transcriptional regulator [Bacteroidales bacterium]HOG67331.1 sigma-54 dependent transcriptional regulator [Bacteroidales bacterium]HPA12655.1 sigma-54 dependent transcriptional regulator [Bacteroidales bacterium]HQO07713.1 sigma-54 dependent transcriptional regulator [Bacteroidales bacterium]
MEIQAIKQRFGIIGNDEKLNRAIDIARQVAATDLTVFITGESGTGKEVFPQIIHQLSVRKHKSYIAVNCGAIPEGTIDSELFGHEKGSFTGAHEARKGYFEEVNGGTIFLDEVAELPLSTQVRLLRVLESGEFLKVGSSKVLKTDVRVIAATNVQVSDAIQRGKFRQDLYYRLNSVPIHIPPLRERRDDIHLLFRKFASDFAEKYRMPTLQLTNEAVALLTSYRWDGNVRQLKNITEQISIIESERLITESTLQKYLPKTPSSSLPVIYSKDDFHNDITDRDILYKVLWDMRRDIAELKRSVDIIKNSEDHKLPTDAEPVIIKNFLNDISESVKTFDDSILTDDDYVQITEEPESVTKKPEESLSIAKNEVEMIKKALAKHNGKRKTAAKELGISERTLYRKIKEHNIN